MANSVESLILMDFVAPRLEHLIEACCRPAGTVQDSLRSLHLTSTKPDKKVAQYLIRGAAVPKLQ